MPAERETLLARKKLLEHMGTQLRLAVLAKESQWDPKALYLSKRGGHSGCVGRVGEQSKRSGHSGQVSIGQGHTGHEAGAPGQGKWHRAGQHNSAESPGVAMRQRLPALLFPFGVLT